MALINIPQYGSNFWGSGVTDRSAQIYLQGKMHNERVKTERFGMLRDIMDELDPKTLMSDAHKVQQSEYIQAIEDHIVAVTKDNKRGGKGALTQQDLIEIQWMVEKYNAWEAGAQTAMKQFEQAYDIYDKAEEGHYQAGRMFTGMQYFQRTGKHPVGGYLEIAPGDFLGDVSELTPFGEEGFVTVKAERVWNGKDWVEKTRTTTEYGVPMEGNIEVIDPAATLREKQRSSMSFLMSDPRYMKWATDGYAVLKDLSQKVGTTLKEAEEIQNTKAEVAKYESMASRYKSNAKAKSFEGDVRGEGRNFPPEVNPAFLWGRDRGVSRIQASSYSDKDKLEGIGFAELRAEQAEEKITPEKKENLEFVGGGSDWSFDGFIQTFTGRKNDSALPMGVRYRPDKTEQVNPDIIPKGAEYMIDGKTYIVSIPPESKIWSNDYLGSFARDVRPALNNDWPIEKAYVDYNVEVYTGESDDYKYEGVKYKFQPNQSISEQEKQALLQKASDEGIDIADIVQKSNRDFARITLKLGSIGGVPGHITVMRELDDGYVATMVPLDDYVPRVHPKEQEKVIPEAAATPEAVVIPEVRKKMSLGELWGAMKGVFKGKKDEELVLELNGVTYTVKELTDSGWTEEEIKQAIEAEKIKAK